MKMEQKQLKSKVVFVLLILLTIISLIVSLYFWGIYAHNLDISYGQIAGFERLYKDGGDVPKEELRLMLEEAKVYQKAYISSEQEWFVKLILDATILTSLILYAIIKPKR